MYNKAKHLTDKIGGILSIVLGSFICLSVLISLISTMQMCSLAGGAFAGVFLGAFIGLIIRCVLGIIFIRFGAETVSKPIFVKLNENTSYWEYGAKSKNIALIVVSGILFFLGLFAEGMVSVIDEIEFLSWAQTLQYILCLAVLGCKIATISINGNPVEKTKSQNSTTITNKPSVTPTTTTKQNLESRIMELKRLKDSGAITDAQYQSAVNKMLG